MSIKTSLLKNTGFNMAGYFYLLLASFFSISILLRNLSSDVFGAYLFLSAFVPLSAVFDFGISVAVIRKLSLPQIDYKEKLLTWKTSFSLFLVISFFLAIIVALTITALSRLVPVLQVIDHQTIIWTTILLSLTVFVNHLSLHFLNLPQAQQRFDIYNSKTFLVGSANTVFSAIVSGFFPNIAIIFLVQFLFHLITLAYVSGYAKRIFLGADFWPHYNRETGRELLGFGLKNFVGTLAGQVEAQYTKLALGTMVSAHAVTAFNIPQNIVSKGAGVVSQFAQAFFPLSASLLTKERVAKLKKMVLTVEAITFVGGGLAVFLSYAVGYDFLLWWLKDVEVASAATPILQILSWQFVLMALTPVPTALVQSINKPQVTSFFASLTTILEIVTTLIFIPKYQALGVAYSFLLSYSISVPLFLIVAWILFQREIKKLKHQV